MANFRGHIGTAAVVGAGSAGAAWWLGYVDPEQATMCFMLTCLGGISPDIDSDNSHSIRVLFNVMAGAVLLIGQALDYLFFGIVGAVVVRYGLIWPFRKRSGHRRIWHSTPMALAVSSFVYLCAHKLESPVAEWLAGFYLAGFMIHLLVDELHGIGKRSQWTAIKIWHRSNPIGYASLYLLSGTLMYLVITARHPVGL